MYETASYYRFKAGYSVIPLKPSTKIPAVTWEKYQKALAGRGELDSWWSVKGTKQTGVDVLKQRDRGSTDLSDMGDAVNNLAIVCGMISKKLVVIDIDPRHGGTLEQLTDNFNLNIDEAAVVCTGSGGWHLYYRHTLTTPLYTTILFPGVELRSEGAIVVAPPSIHPDTGQRYYWEKKDIIHVDNLPVLPQDLQTFAVAKRKDAVGQAREIVEAFGVKPDNIESAAVLMEILTMLGSKVDAQSETIRSLMTGFYANVALDKVDRSGWSYSLARLLVETCVYTKIDKRKIAIAVYCSAIHKAKFGERSDGWVDACRLASRALTDDDAVVQHIEILLDKPEDVGVSIPKDFDQIDFEVPVFPQQACVGIVGDIANHLSKISEAPLSYLYHAALTAFSILVSSYITLEMPVRVKPTIYTIILGHSASSRKSTSMRAVLEFFDSALGDSFSPYTYRGFFGSGEGVMRKLEKQGVNDERGVERTMWSVDEFEEVISRTTMEHSVLAPLLQTLFEDNTFEYTSASKEIKVTNAYLSMLSSSTIDTFKSLWTKRLTEGGLLNRLWLVAPEPVRHLATVPDVSDESERLKEALRQCVYEIVNCSSTMTVGGRTVKLQKVFRIPLSRAAMDRWSKFYLQELPIMQSTAEDAARRLETYALRMILLTAISRGELEAVSVDTVERVLALIDYEFTVRRMLRPPDATSNMARLEQRICSTLLAAEGNVLTKRDLYREIKGWQDGAGVFEAALTNLSKVGFIDVVKGGTGKIYVQLLQALVV